MKEEFLRGAYTKAEIPECVCRKYASGGLLKEKFLRGAYTKAEILECVCRKCVCRWEAEGKIPVRSRHRSGNSGMCMPEMRLQG